MSETGAIYTSRLRYAWLSDYDPQRKEKLGDLKSKDYSFFKRATFEEFMYMTDMSNCEECDDCDEV